MQLLYNCISIIAVFSIQYSHKSMFIVNHPTFCITKDDRLPNMPIELILELHKNKIWIATLRLINVTLKFNEPHLSQPHLIANLEK